MLEVRFSRAAEADFESIAGYTIERFGLEVSDGYRDSLLNAIDSLRRHPKLGTAQDHLLPKLRRLVHQRHGVYYRIRRNDIFVVRILGPGQDPKTQLMKR
jgi:toxin ParE1/3/4